MESTTNGNGNANAGVTASIQALRVAQSELVSGDTSGKVFIRLSNGAAPLLVDRTQAQTHVTKQLRQNLLLEQQQQQQQ